MRRKKEMFLKLFAERESMFKIVSSGSFFLYLNYDKEIGSEELCYRMIEKENIVSLPGTCFGSDQGRALRLALGNVESANIPFVVDKLTGFSI